MFLGNMIYLQRRWLKMKKKAIGQVTPGGLKVAVSLSVSPDFGRRPSHTDTLCASGIRGSKVIRFGCGDDDKSPFRLNIYGVTYRIQSKANCSLCWIEFVKTKCIRCCFCGGLIKPGDGVAGYGAGSKGLRKDATFVGRQTALGCLDGRCCSSGSFFIGHWTESGFDPAFGGNTAGDTAAATVSQVFSATK